MLSIFKNKSAFFKIDPQSFEELYRLYWKAVFGVCYHYTGDRETAAELAQNIFESLWLNREKVKISSNVQHYLLRAAKLEVFEFLRTTARHRQLLECALKDQCTSGHCTEEQVLYNELSSQISLLIHRLPCKCREVYHLSREQGMSNKEIASLLLISEKTVEYHLYKVLGFLKENLRDR